MSERRHGLELRVPPVLVWILFAAVAVGLRRLTPGLAYASAWTPRIASVLAVLGLALALSGVVKFVRVGTTVHPTSPSKASSVVTTGVYAISRNPMYLGLALTLAAFSLWLSHLLAPLSIAGFVIYMNRFQIEPEERALRAKFGDAYADYVKSVRRWV
jgi:protein-S-isoprenylcysteine O-methyltransferase Ste14